MIVQGLSWWQAWLCVWFGYAIAACFIVSTGRIGAVYHIGFPVVGRSSFGIWGSLWPVFNRAAMGMFSNFPFSRQGHKILTKTSFFFVQLASGMECSRILVDTACTS